VEVVWSGQADTHSGVDGFSYGWSQQAETDPGTAKTVEETATGTTSDPLADGSWWFHLRVRDNAGNWSVPIHLGPFKIDATPPTNPTLWSPSHAVGSWSSDSTVVVDWDGGTDVGGYSYQWSEAATTVPDTAKDVEAATTNLSSVLSDGSWWFHLRTLRSSGSWSDASHLGPFRIDTAAPETTITSAPGRIRCRVRRVTGLRLARAGVSIRRSHCALGKISWRYSRALRGRVIAQRPAAGRVLSNRARVSLVVSRGRRG